MLDRVRHFIAQHRLLRTGERVVVGVSGGVDSVVLLHVLARLGYGVVAAHVNYGLRGAESEADEAFVRAQCEALGVPCRLHRAEAAEHDGPSMQAWARKERYGAFERLAVDERARRVAVGHHRDDRAETLLLNLFRGAGPEGLASMRPSRPLGRFVLVRPLLCVGRAEVEAFARAEGLRWREDATNEGDAYRRNVLRRHVLPVVEEHFGRGTRGRIARAAELLGAWVEQGLAPEIDARFRGALREDGGHGVVQLAELAGASRVLRRRVLLEALRRWLPAAPYDEATARRLDALVDAQVGRRLELSGGTVWRERGALRYVPESDEASVPTEPVPLEEGAPVPVAAGRIVVELLDGRPDRLDQGADVAILDADRLAWPLRVRPWLPGDRFGPLGMEGHKYVSDLLTDARVPPHRRAGTSVVLSGDEIVWVAGHRLAHAARVRPESRRFAKISLLRGDSDRAGRPGVPIGEGTS